MARNIIWTNRAQEDRIAIFTYWNERNKSKTYSKRLNMEFVKATQTLSEYPTIGRLTDSKLVRIKVVEHYYILYEFSDDNLYILSIFDSRQDPIKII